MSPSPENTLFEPSLPRRLSFNKILQMGSPHRGGRRFSLFSSVFFPFIFRRNGETALGYGPSGYQRGAKRPMLKITGISLGDSPFFANLGLSNYFQAVFFLNGAFVSYI